MRNFYALHYQPKMPQVHKLQNLSLDQHELTDPWQDHVCSKYERGTSVMYFQSKSLSSQSPGCSAVDGYLRRIFTIHYSVA